MLIQVLIAKKHWCGARWGVEAQGGTIPKGRGVDGANKVGGSAAAPERSRPAGVFTITAEFGRGEVSLPDDLVYMLDQINIVALAFVIEEAEAHEPLGVREALTPVGQCVGGVVTVAGPGGGDAFLDVLGNGVPLDPLNFDGIGPTLMTNSLKHLHRHPSGSSGHGLVRTKVPAMIALARLVTAALSRPMCTG